MLPFSDMSLRENLTKHFRHPGVSDLGSVSELTNQIAAFWIFKVITTILLVNSLIDPRSLTRWEHAFNQIGSNSIPNYLIINSHDFSWAELVLKMLMKPVLFHISVGHYSTILSITEFMPKTLLKYSLWFTLNTN